MTDPEELATQLITELTAGAELTAILERLSAMEQGVAAQILESVARHQQEEAVQFLEGVATGSNHVLAAVAIEALSLHRTASAAEALVRIAEAAPDKQLRKQARRSLHRLRASGIVAPEMPLAAAGPVLVRPHVRYYRGVLTSLDGVGTRAVMVGAERPSGIVDTVLALINVDAGLKDCYAIETSRKGFDQRLSEIQTDMSTVTWVPAPPSYCHFLIYENAKRTAPSASSADLVRCARVLGEPETSYSQPLIYERIPVEEVRGNLLLLQRGPALYQEPEFQGWVLEPDTVRSYAIALSEARQSPLVLSDWIKAERESRIIERAIGELFDRHRLDSYARRLEEMSYVLLETGREEPARIALASALALRSEPQDMVHTNLFLRSLVFSSIEYSLEKAPVGQGKIIIP